MSAAKTPEEKLAPCVNADKGCTTITRPARMQPLASIPTTIRQGGGRCTKCYTADRREARAAAAPPKPKTVKRELSEEERLAHTEAGLQRMMAARLARKSRRAGQSMVRI